LADSTKLLARNRGLLRDKVALTEPSADKTELKVGDVIAGADQIEQHDKRRFIFEIAIYEPGVIEGKSLIKAVVLWPLKCSLVTGATTVQATPAGSTTDCNRSLAARSRREIDPARWSDGAALTRRGFGRPLLTLVSLQFLDHEGDA
jgi:hypothetical protein